MSVLFLFIWNKALEKENCFFPKYWKSSKNYCNLLTIGNHPSNKAGLSGKKKKKNVSETLELPIPKIDRQNRTSTHLQK